MAFEPCEPRHLLTSIPLAFNDTYATPLNTNLSGTGLMSNDWDPDGGTLTASVVANPSHGTLSGFRRFDRDLYVRADFGYSGLDFFHLQNQ